MQQSILSARRGSLSYAGQGIAGGGACLTVPQLKRQVSSPRTSEWKSASAACCAKSHADHHDGHDVRHSHASCSSSEALPQQHQHQVFRPATGISPSQFLTLDSWDFSSEDGYIPSPVNTPTIENDELLYVPQHGPWKRSDAMGIDLLAARYQDVINRVPDVYVILFGVGLKTPEGIYSLKAFTTEGLPEETIIVFELEEDAIRYGALLEATMSHVPSVSRIATTDLVDFCLELGYKCRLEPAGTLVMPAEVNVEVTDWEKSRRLRAGMFAVLEAEPERKPMNSTATVPGWWGGNQGDATRQGPFLWNNTWPATPMLARFYDSLTDSQLIEIKTKLEVLLPPAEGTASGTNAHMSDDLDNGLSAPPNSPTASSGPSLFPLDQPLRDWDWP